MTDADNRSSSPDHLLERVQEIAYQRGAFKVGFANITSLKDLPVGDATTLEYPGAVSFAVEIPEAAVKSAMHDTSEEIREAYKQCNRKLKQSGEGIVEVLTSAGYKARLIDPAERVNPERLLGPISHKAVARLAGMGWIGKSGLLVTPEHGPRVRMGTVLTDMPLEASREPLQNECGDCAACIDNCPTRSLSRSPDFKDHPRERDMVINWAKCGKYENALIGDGSRPEKACGRCIAVCPRSFP